MISAWRRETRSARPLRPARSISGASAPSRDLPTTVRARAMPKGCAYPPATSQASGLDGRSAAGPVRVPFWVRFAPTQEPEDALALGMTGPAGAAAREEAGADLDLAGLEGVPAALAIDSLAEGRAVGVSRAATFTLSVKSWVLAVEDGVGSLSNSVCCAGILAAARAAIALADRARDFILATPAAVLAASEAAVRCGPVEDGSAGIDGDGLLAAEEPGGSAGDCDRVSTTVGALAVEGLAEPAAGERCAPRRLPLD